MSRKKPLDEFSSIFHWPKTSRNAQRYDEWYLAKCSQVRTSRVSDLIINKFQSSLVSEINITRISQQTPSNSSSLVKIPVPDAKQMPINENSGAESPWRNLKNMSENEYILSICARAQHYFFVASFRKFVEYIGVTRCKILSTNKRRACCPKRKRELFRQTGSATFKAPS